VRDSRCPSPLHRNFHDTIATDKAFYQQPYLPR
jgi:hypothetical protein